MKKKIAAIIAFILIFAFSLSTVAFAAEPRANALISYKAGNISSDSSGNLTITFAVQAKEICDTIGASTITIYKASGAYVTTIRSAANSNMLASDTGAHVSSVSYKGEAGQSYYAVIMFTAVLDDVNTTASYTTGKT